MSYSKGKTKSRGSFVVLVILAAFWLIPTVGLFITSLRAKGEAQTSGWWDVFLNPFSQDWDLSSYTTVLTENKLGTSFISSLAVTIPATVLPLLFAAYAAFGFTFLKFRGREFFFSVIIGLLVVPIQGALVPVLKMFISFTDKTGIEISGQYAAAWFVHSAFAMPLAIYILRNYMMTIPNTLIEAARMDGAGPLRFFKDVLLPLSATSIAALFVIQFIYGWNQYLWPLLITNDESMYTAVIGIKRMIVGGDALTEWNLVMATAILAMLPPALVVILMQKWFVKGLVDTEK